ncbi:DUF1543 domain-containing protein [Oceanospirillaceae bacterium ASx5O]|nr:DUF1543 domain-containing protein [Oceanospirillaceae bacterium ASx5O]
MLYMVMLGGHHPRAKIEVHDIVFACGDTLPHTYPALIRNWFGDPKRVHIDAWMQIDGVDDYAVRLRPEPPAAGPRLYFVNLGGYLKQVFGEDHRYLLLVADDMQSAKQQAKARAGELWLKPHRDNLAEVDDCLQLDQIEGLFVHLVREPHQGCAFRNDYIVL